MNWEQISFLQNFEKWQIVTKYFCILYTHFLCLILLLVGTGFRLSVCVWIYLIFFMAFYINVTGDDDEMRIALELKQRLKKIIKNFQLNYNKRQIDANEIRLETESNQTLGINYFQETRTIFEQL
jgi:protein-S-isoprenylcysteine O-methyltransferase Ste14